MYSNFAHNILLYDLKSGENINSIKDPETDFWTESFHYYKMNLFLISSNSSQNFFFKVYDLSDMHCILKWPIRYQTDSKSLNSIAEYSTMYTQDFNDTLLFKEMFNDTLYQTTNFQDYTSRYIFKGGDKLTYESYHQFLSNPTKAKIDNKLIIGRFLEDPKYLFFYSYNGKESNIFIYDKKNKKLSAYKGTVIINDLDGGVNFKMNWDPHSTIYHNGNIYCLLDPFKDVKGLDEKNIKADKLRNLTSIINEFSNPVLMIVKLK